MPEKQQRSPLSTTRILFYALSPVVFYLAIRYTGRLQDIRALLMQMRPAWLILAIAAQLATYLFNMLILRTLLMGKTGTGGFKVLLKLSIVIMFINQVLPTGGISGNGYIFNQLVKRKVPAAFAFRALVLESICYYIAFLILLGTFYSWYAHNASHVAAVMHYTLITGFAFFMSLGGLILILSNRHAITFVLRKLSYFKRVRQYIVKTGMVSLSKGNTTSLRGLFENRKSVALAVLFQIAILSCDMLTVFAIMAGFRVSLDAGRIMLGLLLTLVIGSLPVSPGGLIAYESAMTYFYTLLGVPVHAALIVTLLFRFFSFWLPIPAGLWLYRDLAHH